MSFSGIRKLCSLVFISIPSLLWSQETFTYSGPLQVGDYQGIADFTYFLIEEDSVLNGPFIFNSADLDALIKSGDRYFSIQGAYKQNIPSGFWQFNFGEFEGGSTTVLRDNEYRVSLNGINHSAKGRIINGKPDGTWTHSVHELNNSDIVSTPFESIIEFTLGVPQFSFQIRNQHATLVGRFLRDGLAHGRWELFSGSGSSESWEFNNGLLRSIDIQDGGLKRHIDIFTSDAGETVRINLDQRFMDLLALKRRLLVGADSTFTSNIYSLLSENTRYYDEVEKILSEISETQFTPEYKVLVPHYPLTDSEHVQLDSIEQFIRAAQVQANIIEEDTQLQLLRLTDKEVGFLMAATEQINEALISPLSLLVRFKQQGVLPYVGRNDLLEMLGLSSTPESTFVVNLEDASGTMDLATAPGWEGDTTPLNHAYSAAQSLQNTIHEIGALLEQKRSLKEREEKLADLEKDLIDAMGRLTDQTDSLSAMVLDPISSTIRRVETVARVNLKEYSEFTDLAFKVNRASELIACFNDMYELNEVLAGLPDDQLTINELYSDDVWNPFTLTVMDEDIKKRITSAYQDVLVPYILNSIQSDLDCTNVCRYIRLIEAIHERMNELLEEDTTRLERKLKREQDPEVILELFGIQENS